MDVGGDLASFLFLRGLDLLREFAPLLDRATQHLEAPPELLLRFLLGGHVEHDAAPVLRFAVLVAHEHARRRGSTRCARPSRRCGTRRGTAHRRAFDRSFSARTASTSSGWTMRIQSSGSCPIPPACSRATPRPAGSCRSWRSTRRGGRDTGWRGCPPPTPGSPRRRGRRARRASARQTLEINPASRATRGTTLVRSSHSAGA